MIRIRSAIAMGVIAAGATAGAVAMRRHFVSSELVFYFPARSPVGVGVGHAVFYV